MISEIFIRFEIFYKNDFLWPENAEITWFQLDSATVSEIFKKSISKIPRSTRRSYQLCKFSAESRI